MASVNGWILGISAAISALLAPFSSGGLIALAVLALAIYFAVDRMLRRSLPWQPESYGGYGAGDD